MKNDTRKWGTVCVEPGGKTLAKAWCNKHQYFFDLFVYHGAAADYNFPPEHFVEYAEPQDLTDLFNSANPATRERVEKLRKIQPRLVV